MFDNLLLKNIIIKNYNFNNIYLLLKKFINNFY